MKCVMKCNVNSPDALWYASRLLVDERWVDARDCPSSCDSSELAVVPASAAKVVSCVLSCRGFDGPLAKWALQFIGNSSHKLRPVKNQACDMRDIFNTRQRVQKTSEPAAHQM